MLGLALAAGTAGPAAGGRSAAGAGAEDTAAAPERPGEEPGGAAAEHEPAGDPAGAVRVAGPRKPRRPPRAPGAGQPGRNDAGPDDPAHEPVGMSPEAHAVPHDAAAFRPDPGYADEAYDAAAQLAIYGGKRRNPTQRPAIEWGRALYAGGPFRRSASALGEKNLASPTLLAYGDVRLGTSRIDGGASPFDAWGARLNLDVDWQLTATERVHAFVGPLDQDGEFVGSANHDPEDALDGNLDAIFFEGELGAIVSGARGKDSRFDLPFAFGLMPLQLQNGVWLEDAVGGLALTIPARNSRRLDVSNMDVTLFAAFDRVDSAAVSDDGAANVYGVAAFVEAREGYCELGYGYTDDRRGDGAASYHNLAFAFLRRYGAWLSNTVRLVGNFGQDAPPTGPRTADGALLLVESSFITRQPYTVVPYVNLFAGFDQPQSLARDPQAGGILKNTGLAFETDGLTGTPTLDATGHNTWGGAAGLELLFDFTRQLVLEVAGLEAHGPADERTAVGGQAALAFRYQQPLNHAAIVRVDGLYGRRQGEEDIWSGRVELRYKF